MNIGFAENFNIEFTIHLKEGVKISKKLNFEKMNWALILNIGLCYQNLREYDMSMRYYEKALEISKK